MRFLVLAVLALLTVGPAWAMAGPGGAGSAGAPGDPDVAAGDKALAAKDWPLAVAAYTKSLEVPANSQSAELQNRLGFALRNAGKVDEALGAYAKALAIDPKHKGAHEYAGEAYLRKGDLAKAKQHLAELNKLCLFGCAEHTDLKDKIARVEAGKPLSN